MLTDFSLVAIMIAMMMMMIAMIIAMMTIVGTAPSATDLGSDRNALPTPLPPSPPHLSTSLLFTFNKHTYSISRYCTAALYCTVQCRIVLYSVVLLCVMSCRVAVCIRVLHRRSVRGLG